MTTFVIHELVTNLIQPFNVNVGYRLQMHTVRPYLFFNDAPAGTFTLGLYSGATLLDSDSITFAQIKSYIATTDDYIAAFCSFRFSSNPVLNPGVYSLKLTSTGYAYDQAIYVGWISLHENLINQITYSPVSDEENPLTYQLWGHRWLES